jgi:hypothetical protein
VIRRLQHEESEILHILSCMCDLDSEQFWGRWVMSSESGDTAKWCLGIVLGHVPGLREQSQGQGTQNQ